MTLCARICRALVVALACSAVLAAPAPAQTPEQTDAWNRVRDAFAASGANLDACTFTQADLQAALAGIPAELRETVPDIRRAIEDGIASHANGECEGVEPTASNGTATTPGAATPPPVTTPTTPEGAAVTPGAATPDAGAGAATPGTTTPAPGTATPAPAADGTVTTPGAQQPGVARDRTPLLVGLVALGALLVLALALWGLARLRGWDPPFLARVRHAWGEAGYRATSTWSEFTDWLRLGR